MKRDALTFACLSASLVVGANVLPGPGLWVLWMSAGLCAGLAVLFWLFRWLDEV